MRVGLLLAAGASRRFGAEDKLLAPLAGRPLVAHAAAALAAARFDLRLAVVSSAAVAAALPGLVAVWVPPGGGMGDSLRAGVAGAGDWARLTVVLGDMPRIEAAHLDALGELARDDQPAATLGPDGAMVPACFPAAWRPRLAGLGGDAGAHALLGALPAAALVAAPAGALADVDRPGDLPVRV